MARQDAHGLIAFVLGGGGILGAAEVGMLAALAEAEVVPGLILGSSVGAINGAAYAADPGVAVAARLTEMWASPDSAEVFPGTVARQLGTLARSRTHLFDNHGLRRLIEREAPGVAIEDLAVPFQCVAASVERAAPHWFDRGPLLEAVLASCAVPGLLPSVRIGDEHFFDGGLVDSLPVGRALALGATEIYVLHVGRLERPLTAPRWPWEVAAVAFEVARRSRFTEAMANLPDDVRVHVLPTGSDPTPIASMRYRSTRRVEQRIEAAHAATARYLDRAKESA